MFRSVVFSKLWKNLFISFKIPKKKGPSSRSSVEAENSTSVSNFKSQRFFGPPVLSAIPDELVDVNPKRQTFAVKGSLSKVQLPIISTPVKDRETYLESKENILTVHRLLIIHFILSEIKIIFCRVLYQHGRFAIYSHLKWLTVLLFNQKAMRCSLYL